MEQWQCHKTCFFRSRLYNPGDIVTGKDEEIPRHFRSVNNNKPGSFGKKDVQKAEKVQLEEIMKDSPLLEKAKYLSQMNKIELCALGRSLGVIFNAEEMTRADMIKQCVEIKEKKGTTNQEICDIAKR